MIGLVMNFHGAPVFQTEPSGSEGSEKLRVSARITVPRFGSVPRRQKKRERRGMSDIQERRKTVNYVVRRFVRSLKEWTKIVAECQRESVEATQFGYSPDRKM
jgi:hypothetical protein